MVDICLYFQVHQPYRMKKYRVFDIGNSHEYFDEETNKEICRRVTEKCYIPANKMMLRLIREHGDSFKVSYSITGTAMEQLEIYAPEVLDSFKELADTGNVEFLAETYHHTLAYLYSEKEFDEQVRLHAELMKKHFGVTPKVFRNTELIYDNRLAKFAENLGYTGILSEGPDQVLGWRSPNMLYRPKGTSSIALLLKNFKLSDDVAFRFSNKNWKHWPLTAEKFSDWIKSVESGDSLNIFMDYETLGEHHWEETGIFGFFEKLPEYLVKDGLRFRTPSEVIVSHEPSEELDVPSSISWADEERDVSAWTHNDMQQNALSEIFKVEEAVKAAGDEQLLNDWRMLTTSDHFYYMSTKKMNDGMVHNYFSPYATPYDSFISYMNIMNDLVHRLTEKHINQEVPKALMVVSESPSATLAQLRKQ